MRSAPGRRTRRRLVIPTRRCTPGGTRGARPYAATGAACPAARAQDLLARIVSGDRRAARTWTRVFPVALASTGRACTLEPLRRARRLGRQVRGPRRSPPAPLARFGAPVEVPSPPGTHMSRGGARPAIGTLERAALALSAPPASVGSRPGPTFEGGPGVFSLTAASPCAVALPPVYSGRLLAFGWLTAPGGGRRWRSAPPCGQQVDRIAATTTGVSGLRGIARRLRRRPEAGGEVSRTNGLERHRATSLPGLHGRAPRLRPSRGRQVPRRLGGLDRDGRGQGSRSVLPTSTSDLRWTNAFGQRVELAVVSLLVERLGRFLPVGVPGMARGPATAGRNRRR